MAYHGGPLAYLGQCSHSCSRSHSHSRHANTAQQSERGPVAFPHGMLAGECWLVHVGAECAYASSALVLWAMLMVLSLMKDLPLALLYFLRCGVFGWLRLCALMASSALTLMLPMLWCQLQ